MKQAKSPVFALPTTPAWRIDVDIFCGGLGYTDADPASGSAMIAGQGGVRVALRSGHGFFTHVGYWYGPDDQLNVQGGYLYRFRLAGDDRLGLGLDLSAGLGGGWSDTYANRRARIGPNAGVSLDGRLTGFIIGLVVRAHAFFGRDPAHTVTTVMLRVSFGFWGRGA